MLVNFLTIKRHSKNYYENYTVKETTENFKREVVTKSLQTNITLINNK